MLEWSQMATEVYRKVSGYDNSAFAMGAFLSKAVFNLAGNDGEYIDIPLSLPPLTMSLEKEAAQLMPSISRQIDTIVTTALAYIANELG